MTTVNSLSVSLAKQVSLLRALGLVLQLALVFWGAEAFGLSLQLEPLTHVFVLELLYLLLTLGLNKRLFQHELGLFIALLIDTLFWISWLYFSGAATNAFISLLLLPIALAAVTLPSWAPWSLSLLSILAYSLMIFNEPQSAMQHHGMDMSSHYLGMWLNFVISALVITSSVALMARRLRRQDAELAFMREAQLRQEQLLALGTASAQMAHQLATPLSSLRLLLDEVCEDVGHTEATTDMGTALSRCELTLAELRRATESIRSRVRSLISVQDLQQDLKQKVLLLMPNISLEWQLAPPSMPYDQLSLATDMSLIPAIMTLIDNAARASLEAQGEAKVVVTVSCEPSSAQLLIRVRDFGSGIDVHLLEQLGHKLVQSPTGMGVALMVSHASFERLGGQLILANHNDGGTVAQVSLTVTEQVFVSEGQQ